MLIQQLDEVSSNTVNQDDLMNYLSQVVLSKTDNNISKLNKKYEESKINLVKLKDQLNKIKKTNSEVSNEHAKQKQLSRVISLIMSLKKEGVIRGNLRLKIIKLLSNVYKMDFYQLRDVEQEYSIHLPNKYQQKQ